MEHYEKSAFENQLFIMLQSIIIFECESTSIMISKSVGYNLVFQKLK